MRSALAAGRLAGPRLGTARAELSDDEVIARFKHEPTVKQVQDAAIRYYQVHPERIRSLRLNAQLKGLIPTVSGGFSNSLSTTKRKMSDGLYIALPQGRRAAHADSRSFLVTATWSLDRLLFNAEVLDVQSLIGILDGVVREVTTIYYIRRRLQVDSLLAPPRDQASRISQAIRVEELTGLLDAMTGGFMSKSIRKADTAAAGRTAAPTAMRAALISRLTRQVKGTPARR